MAKISAYGDEKLREWKDEDGCRLVLTKQGRVLRNYLKGDALTTLTGRVVTKGQQLPQQRIDRVAALAERLGFTEEVL